MKSETYLPITVWLILEPVCVRFGVCGWVGVYVCACVCWFGVCVGVLVCP